MTHLRLRFRRQGHGAKAEDQGARQQAKIVNFFLFIAPLFLFYCMTKQHRPRIKDNKSS